VTAVQLDLFPDLEIRPTIDDRRVGATYLRMCSHCGLLIALFDCGSYRRNSPLGGLPPVRPQRLVADRSAGGPVPLQGDPVNRYRISTSAELESGDRDEVFDVEADAFQITNKGGVRVLRYVEPRQSVIARLLAAVHPPTENVAWVPHDSLISCRQLTDAEADAIRLPPPVAGGRIPDSDPAYDGAFGRSVRSEARIQ
jgi:hypothetical protein